MADLPFALSGPLSNARCVSPFCAGHARGTITVRESTLTVEYGSADEERVAERRGHALAARLGARLGADIVWTITDGRASNANASTRFRLVAPLRDEDLDGAIREGECFDHHPYLAEIDDHLASYRRTRREHFLRHAVDLLAKFAPRHIPESPLLAGSAMKELTRAAAAHAHGSAAESKTIRDPALRNIDVCEERALDLFTAIVQRVCP